MRPTPAAKLTVRAVGADDHDSRDLRRQRCGMTAEQMRHLFDPFHSTKSSDNHLGLGLFVSHEIVRQHGGDLLVEKSTGRRYDHHCRIALEPLPLLAEEIA